MTFRSQKKKQERNKSLNQKFYKTKRTDQLGYYRFYLRIKLAAQRILGKNLKEY